jgi:MFS family permease
VKGARATADTPGSGIAGRFNLSEAQDGALYSSFMVGLLFGSPAFAEASKYYNPLRIIALGLGAWVLSTAGCAASASFGSLVFFRCAVRLPPTRPRSLAVSAARERPLQCRCADVACGTPGRAGRPW